jgi:anti-sigma factor ChrR (cupin superfamily)
MFALGTLLPEEAAAFASHLESCAACRAEVGAFEQVTGDLALMAEPAAPSPRVRERVLAAARLPFEFVTASDGEWLPVAPGVAHKPLGSGITSKSYLLRVDAGHAVPRHTHALVEHCLVVSGTVEVAGRTLHPGDFHLAARGSVHERVASRTGCVLLIVEAS